MALNQLDSIVQINSASSEQMAATSEELSAQAAHLHDIIAFFKVSHQQGRSTGIVSSPRGQLALLDHNARNQES